MDVRTSGLGTPLRAECAGSVIMRTDEEQRRLKFREPGTRIALRRRDSIAWARGRTKPLREGLDDLQNSRATVTIPDLIPVDTNANLRC